MPWRRAAVGCAALFASAAALADGDPFAGRWLLDAAQSHYAGVTLPQRMEILIEPAEGGIHYRSTTLADDGRTASAEYTADFDGSPVIVTGNVGLRAPVALRRIDALTIDAEYVRGLQTIASSRWVLSPDARRLTMTTSSKAADGAAQVNISVFRRLP